MIYKYLNSFDGGFSLRLTNDGITDTKTVISQYELSRNNVKGKSVRCVKFLNTENFSDVFLIASNDEVLFPAKAGGLQPLFIGSGDLIITASWSTPSTKTFTFYYVDLGGYIFDIPTPTP